MKKYVDPDQLDKLLLDHMLETMGDSPSPRHAIEAADRMVSAILQTMGFTSAPLYEEIRRRSVQA